MSCWAEEEAAAAAAELGRRRRRRSAPAAHTGGCNGLKTSLFGAMFRYGERFGFWFPVVFGGTRLEPRRRVVRTGRLHAQFWQLSSASSLCFQPRILKSSLPPYSWYNSLTDYFTGGDFSGVYWIYSVRKRLGLFVIPRVISVQQGQFSSGLNPLHC